MEATKGNIERDLYLIVMANLYCLHPNKAIPPIPWFHAYRNIAGETLMKALKESEFIHEQFAKRVVKILLDYKTQYESENMKKVSLLRESIDIVNAMRLATISRIVENLIIFRIRKSQSIYGPVTIFLMYSKFVFNLEEGEEVKFPIRLTDNITFKFSLSGSEERLKLTDQLFSLIKILSTFHYLSVMEKGLIEDQIQYKSDEHEIIIDYQLFIAKSERIRKLAMKNSECEKLLSEINNSDSIYENLLQILKIREIDNGFASTIDEGRMRDRCCVDCQVY
ncbi:hypothetical protein SteCoe_32000 [Stentor coeruleus]|uniref:Uncharacterized protein n=1 Tax=Stentor coeruleus TaxID=5963 RepID=A0A1R2B068_9CILI|nr:hypothetical protein SteCoe_32000 [Stentor coeruleus]